MPDDNTHIPTAKMTAVALGGAFATITAWFLTLAGIDPPSAVVAAFAVIFAWVCGYVTHD